MHSTSSPRAPSEVAPSVARRLVSALDTPLAVAVTVLCAYGIWAAYAVRHRPVVALAHVGYQFQHRNGHSAAIDALRSSPKDYSGYDGQFYLYTALDPRHAKAYLDEPAYRLSRPAYPLAARALALGRRGAVPWALLLLGIAGAAAGTLALATILRRDGISSWYGALFGFYPGLFVGVSWDLAEPLAYGLVAFGLLAFGREGRRLIGAAILFAAAGVTRETTLLFPLALAVWLAVGARRRRDAAVLLLVSTIPYVLVKGSLAVWLHSLGVAQATRLAPAPFLGLFEQWPWADAQVEQILSVVAPAVLALCLAWLACRSFTPELSVLAANVLVLVVLLPTPSYADYLAAGRIATGVVVAFLLCLPRVLASGRIAQAWIVAALWLAPWYFWLPNAFKR